MSSVGYIMKYPWEHQEDFLNASKIQLRQWREEAEEIDRQNSEIKKQKIALYEELKSIAIGLWGDNSNEVRYIKKHGVSSFSRNYFSTGRVQNFNLNIEWREKQKQKDNGW